MHRLVVLGVALVALLAPTGSLAAKIGGGAVIVRVSDPELSRCIDGSADMVSVHLVTMREERRKSLIRGNTKAVGLYITTTLDGSTGSTTRKVSFPRSFLIDVSDYEQGVIAIPVEERLLSRFLLSNGDNVYSSATFRIQNVSVTGEGAAVKAFKVLADVTKKVPIPGNPFAAGTEFFVELGNSLIQEFVENDGDQTPADAAQITLEFAPDNNCSGGMESTGAIAVIKEMPSGPGAVDVRRANALCFVYRSQPSRQLVFAEKTDLKCPENETAFRPVLNPYSLFTLNAIKRKADQTTTTSQVALPTFAPQGLTQKAAGDRDYADIYASWKTVAAADAEDSDSLLSAIKKYASVSPGQTDSELARLGVKGFSGDSEAGKLIAFNLGTETEMWDATTIFGQQSLPGYESVAQDIAIATRRCEAFGIPAEDCL